MRGWFREWWSRAPLWRRLALIHALLLLVVLGYLAVLYSLTGWE